MRSSRVLDELYSRVADEIWRLTTHTVNVDFIRIEYMVLAKYQHLSILELILLVKQHILILCKNLLWLLF
jgi:hypothetical protein